jgi:hypothetical protein
LSKKGVKKRKLSVKRKVSTKSKKRPSSLGGKTFQRVVKSSDTFCRVRGSNLVSALTSSNGVAIGSLRINPASLALSAWLGTQASLWEQYKFNKLRFRYVSTSGDANTAAVGVVDLAVVYDASLDGPTSRVQLTSLSSNKSEKPTRNFSIEVIVDSKETPSLPRYCRVSNDPVYDPRTDDLGYLYTCTSGMSVDPAPFVCGEIHVDYDVSFFKAKPATLGLPQFASFDIISGDGDGFTDDAPMGLESKTGKKFRFSGGGLGLSTADPEGKGQTLSFSSAHGKRGADLAFGDQAYPLDSDSVYSLQARWTGSGAPDVIESPIIDLDGLERVDLVADSADFTAVYSGWGGWVKSISSGIVSYGQQLYFRSYPSAADRASHQKIIFTKVVMPLATRLCQIVVTKVGKWADLNPQYLSSSLRGDSGSLVLPELKYSSDPIPDPITPTGPWSNGGCADMVQAQYMFYGPSINQASPFGILGNITKRGQSTCDLKFANGNGRIYFLDTVPAGFYYLSMGYYGDSLTTGRQPTVVLGGGMVGWRVFDNQSLYSVSLSSADTSGSLFINMCLQVPPVGTVGRYIDVFSGNLCSPVAGPHPGGDIFIFQMPAPLAARSVRMNPVSMVLEESPAVGLLEESKDSKESKDDLPGMDFSPEEWEFIKLKRSSRVPSTPTLSLSPSGPSLPGSSAFIRSSSKH